MLASGGYLYEHMDECADSAGAVHQARDAQVSADRRNGRSGGARDANDRRQCASIYPAVQNVILACRALGLGTVITTNHLMYENEVKEVLGLPSRFRRMR